MSIFDRVKAVPTGRVFFAFFPEHELKRDGSVLAALCIFHVEQTASLKIYGNGFKCFGCGAFGSNIDLLIKSGKAATPIEAAELIAAKFNINFDDDKRPKEGGLTVEELAAAKKLPVSFLNSLKVVNHKYNGKPAVLMIYQTEDGQEAISRYRLKLTGKNNFRPRSGERQTLYGLQTLKSVREKKWVMLVEGESDSWTCWYYDIPCLGVPGKTNWKPEMRDYLTDLDVYVWEEPQARDFTLRILADLPDAKIIVAPDGVKDISEAHIQDKDIPALIEELKAAALDADQVRYAEDEPVNNNNGKSQADILIMLALRSGAELFHTPTDDLYVSFDVKGHRETWPVRSKATRRWLIRGFYLTTGKAPNIEAVQTALNLLEAKAQFDGKEIETHLRTAWAGGALWYDLCDDKWRAIRVSQNGWRVVAKPPVKFIRHRHMAAQVEPEHGGNLDDLFKYINVPSPTDQKLLRTWNVVGLVPGIPRPVQALHGGQGSGKSTTAKRQRDLIDPARVSLLRAKDESEIVQGLDHHYCAIFDNLTFVGDWLSDILSRAVTGEGFTKRKLYTDTEDVLFAYHRLLIVTGIGLVVTKPDLLDRSLIIGVDQIPDPERIPEKELDADFLRAKPKLFGAMLDHLVGALKVHGKMKFENLPRMADFAKWSIEVEVGMGRDPEEWRQAYWVNVGRQNEEAVAASTVATVLLALLEKTSPWSGTPQELYAALKTNADEQKIPGKSFPGSVSVMGRKLREVIPNLFAHGWKVEFSKSGKRTVTVTRLSTENAVRAVHAVQGVQNTNDFPDSNLDSKDGRGNLAVQKNPNDFNGTDSKDSKDSKIPTSSGRGSIG